MLSRRDKLKYHIKTRICHVKTDVSFFRLSFSDMAGDGFDLPNKTTMMNVDMGNGFSIGDKLTLLLHKGVVESATKLHKKEVYAALMIPFKGHYWVDPADHIDLTAVPLWLGV